MASKRASKKDKPVTPARAASRSRNLSIEEQVTILTMTENGAGCTDIASHIGREHSTVSRYLSKMRDSRTLAKAVLQSGAAILANRVIKSANVKEAIDVLSRPDIGVLAPMPDHRSMGAGNGFGIQVSVGIASNGTVVKVEAGKIGEGEDHGNGQVESGSASGSAPSIVGRGQTPAVLGPG